MVPSYKPYLHNNYGYFSQEPINTTAPPPRLRPALPPCPDPFRTRFSSHPSPNQAFHRPLTINRSNVPANPPAIQFVEKGPITVPPRTNPVPFSVPTLNLSRSEALPYSYSRTHRLPSVSSILQFQSTVRNEAQHLPQSTALQPNQFEGNTMKDMIQDGNIRASAVLPKTDFSQAESAIQDHAKVTLPIENPSSQMRESRADQFLPSISQTVTQSQSEIIPQPFPRQTSPHYHAQSHMYQPSDSALEQLHLVQAPMIVPSHPAEVYHSRDFEYVNSSQGMHQVPRSHHQYHQEAQRYSETHHQVHNYAQVERNYPRGYPSYQVDYGDSPLHQVAQISQNRAQEIIPSSNHLPSLENIETGQGTIINNCLPPLTGSLGGRNMHDGNLYPYPTRARPELLPVYRAVCENNIGATTTPLSGYDSIRGAEIERIPRTPGLRTRSEGRISKRRPSANRNRLRTRVDHLLEIDTRGGEEPLNNQMPNDETRDDVAAGRTINDMMRVVEIEGMIHERKQHECSECGLTFRDIKTRDMHFRNAHTRRYRCEHCDAAFKTRSDMNRHVRIVHEKQRNFPCEHCNSKFSERNKLKRHVQTVHEKLRPYICPICNSGFGEIGNLRQHAHSIHPGIDIDTDAIKKEAQRRSDRQLVS